MSKHERTPSTSQMLSNVARRQLSRRSSVLSGLLALFLCFLVFNAYGPNGPHLGLDGLDWRKEPNLPSGTWNHYGVQPGPHLSTHDPNNFTTTLVMGRIDEDPWVVEWIHHLLDDITSKAIYIVDDPTAPLNLKKNKGREAMVYIKYIVDHYDDLNDITLFFHPNRESWHNNVLFNKDSSATINHLSREFVWKEGYVNSRCDPYPGCPMWIKFDADKEMQTKHQDRLLDLFSPDLWHGLFPGAPEPNYLSEACCSQFAVSREAIQSNPKEVYQRFHDWLGKTNMFDGYTGRIMEYMWQYLFLGKEEYCPAVEECYCNAYNLCLEDKTELYEYNHMMQVVDTWIGLSDAERVSFAGDKFADFDAAKNRLEELEKELPRKYGPDSVKPGKKLKNQSAKTAAKPVLGGKPKTGPTH